MDSTKKGDALGHLFVQTEGGRWGWAEEALLLEGLARVQTRKDGVGRASELLAAESAARSAKRGLWAETAYAVKDPVRHVERLRTIGEACRTARRCNDDRVEPTQARQTDARVIKSAASPPPPTAENCAAARELCMADEFQIVEGRVRAVFIAKSGGVHLNFGSDYKTDFSVYIAPSDVAAWTGGAQTLQALEGQRVRVRGDVDSFNGPSIRLHHPAAIEVVAEPQP